MEMTKLDRIKYMYNGTYFGKYDQEEFEGWKRNVWWWRDVVLEVAGDTIADGLSLSDNGTEVGWGRWQYVMSDALNQVDDLVEGIKLCFFKPSDEKQGVFTLIRFGVVALPILEFTCLMNRLNCQRVDAETGKSKTDSMSKVVMIIANFSLRLVKVAIGLTKRLAADSKIHSIGTKIHKGADLCSFLEDLDDRSAKEVDELFDEKLKCNTGLPKANGDHALIKDFKSSECTIEAGLKYLVYDGRGTLVDMFFLFFGRVMGAVAVYHGIWNDNGSKTENVVYEASLEGLKVITDIPVAIKKNDFKGVDSWAKFCDGLSTGAGGISSILYILAGSEACSDDSEGLYISGSVFLGLSTVLDSLVMYNQYKSLKIPNKTNPSSYKI